MRPTILAALALVVSRLAPLLSRFDVIASLPSARVQVERLLYVRSGEAAKRIALAFDALAADVYWIRAIQHYGGDRRR